MDNLQIGVAARMAAGESPLSVVLSQGQAMAATLDRYKAHDAQCRAKDAAHSARLAEAAARYSYTINPLKVAVMVGLALFWGVVIMGACTMCAPAPQTHAHSTQ